MGWKTCCFIALVGGRERSVSLLKIIGINGLGLMLNPFCLLTRNNHKKSEYGPFLLLVQTFWLPGERNFMLAG